MCRSPLCGIPRHFVPIIGESSINHQDSDIKTHLQHLGPTATVSCVFLAAGVMYVYEERVSSH